METIQALKKQIRVWSKIKKDTRVGTQQRRDINIKIRILKDKIQNIQGIMTPEKLTLIHEIYRLEPYLKTLQRFDLRNYTIGQLTGHKGKLKTKKQQERLDGKYTVKQILQHLKNKEKSND